MQQVKIFRGCQETEKTLEQQVNEWLAVGPGKVTKVLQSAVSWNKNEEQHSEYIVTILTIFYESE